ncbi:glycosyltransferase family 4 protein [Candidatus Pelagibacter sp.]|nr:glycosyltransferase family 4 protein [Candidatus Pelagibacter sp.]
MKIQYISGSIFPSEISHTLSKMRMCQALNDAGHEVMITAVQGEISKDLIGYYGLKGGFKIVLQKINKILKNKIANKLLVKSLVNGLFHRNQVKLFKPDLIYSRLTICELMFVSNKIPIIYEMHSLGAFGKSFLEKNLFKIILKMKNFRKIVVTTQILAEMLKEYIQDVDIVVSRLSAEQPIDLKNEELQYFKKENLNGKNFDKHVGYTGYIDTVGLRGTDIICQIASKMPSVAFHIVGGSPETVDHWIEYAKDYNKNKNIFFYGYKNPSMMPYFLNCFNVVLAPLQYRPEARAPLGANMSPLKLTQYMAYKKAMVVSDLIAHRELLNEGKTALFVKCDDINAWQNAIQILLNSQQKREIMGKNAYKEYLKNFTPEFRVKKILNNIDV